MHKVATMRAFEYYKQAADLGDAKAQFTIGILYFFGNGTEKDVATAREWWAKSAAQGHDIAIKNLKILEKNNK